MNANGSNGAGGGSSFEAPARLAGLPPYPLAAVPDIKARLRAAGEVVYDFGVGDSGLPVPDVAVETLRAAAVDPSLQGYGFQRGLPRFREAAALWMARRFGANVDPDSEILPVIGSKEAIALLAFAVLDPGDTALVPDPGYAPYFGGSFFAGARIVRVPLLRENGFLVPPDRIRQAPGRLRLVYLNYPNNPTAASPDRSYLEEVVSACAERSAVLLWDNAYSEVTFDGYRAPGLLEVPGGRETGIELHSFSKSWNMTGWRLGWATGNSEVLASLRRVKTFFDSGSYLAIQAAGAAVLEDSERWTKRTVERLQTRRDAAVPAFRAAGFDLEVPKATLYLWMRVPGEEDSESFCLRMLEEAHVVLLPGSALGDGGEGYVRASLTLDSDLFAQACARLGQVL
ncbi:MAG: aminotransferase class I/II-fold pyridoxal phosphate-dependent enzyme [marine benthic group bacterium]|nr:aminotransferase class I/II-fold pyridoxal phosphate-dependent enzyme [Gemmatimonadota bacterium]MCL7968113.1 aminotransferase class I/II-fold pyridoxal phosphate-dependent enzyme [Gemmatimonadota bacterium]